MILNLYLNGIDWKPNLKCPLDLQPNINWSYKPVGAHSYNKAYFNFATSKKGYTNICDSTYLWIWSYRGIKGI